MKIDIKNFFGNVRHEAILDKLNCHKDIKRLVKGWLEAGILTDEEIVYPQAGTAQGGVISPLLANIALHGLEGHVVDGPLKDNRLVRDWTKTYTRPKPPLLVRYADDMVLLHHDWNVIQERKQRIIDWLQLLGLELNENKTIEGHTLENYDATGGINFLGHHIRQYPCDGDPFGIFGEASPEGMDKDLYGVSYENQPGVYDTVMAIRGWLPTKEGEKNAYRLKAKILGLGYVEHIQPWY